MVRRAPTSPSGRRTPPAFRWSGISTAGTPLRTLCGAAAPRGSGRASSPEWVREAATSTASLPSLGGRVVDKADPFAFHTEVPPLTASTVWSLDYEWMDQEWMESRAARARLDAPMSIYEVHLGSWRSREGGGSTARLPRAGAAARGSRARDGLHPRRIPAGDGTPLLRLVGLPDHRILRAEPAATGPRRTSCT